ncbi:MAG: rod shape-determining protein RodA [Acidobacteriota bacterium]|nr:rod shape-determining protein RodA [Acidobacteriota bacterium]
MRDTSGSFPTIAIPEDGRFTGGRLKRIERVAWSLPVCALALAVAGLTVIQSASVEMATDFVSRQIVWVGLGVVVMIIGFSVSHTTLLRFAFPLYLAGLAMLGSLLFFGHEAGGARSWFGIAGLGGQPADFMKVASVLMLVRYLCSAENRRLHEREVLIAAAIVGIPAALIALQPDLGSAVMLFPALASLVWLSGLRTKTLAAAFVLVVITGAAAWTFGLKDYQRDRILTFVQPETDPLGRGYQLRQSKIAVGSGELVGKGFMQGTQSQLRFLPVRHTDFVFAVLAEERGFVGVLATLALFLYYLWSCVRVATRGRDGQAILLVIGLASIMGFHIFYNTGMMIGLVPITGIPLPFLSYGGSFTLFCFFSTGVITGVDYRRWVNR